MRVNGNELIVHRNETFTIDKVLLAKDGAPFIVSSRLENPYICITVASSRYDQYGKYEHTWWLDQSLGYNTNGDLIVPLVRFNSTSPIHLTGDSWDVPLPTNPDTGELYDEFEALWYINLPDGTKQYKRWDLTRGAWVDYQFRIVKTFTHDDTKNWVEQDYKYNIVLVAGTTVLEYLEELKLQVFMEINDINDPDMFLDATYVNYDIVLGEAWAELPTNTTGIYKWLKSINRDLIKDLDITAPILNYSAVQVILPPTKLTVQSSLRGGL